MAIDTAAKRASVQAYTLGLMRPPPDGTVSAADRAVAAWFYTGLTFTPPEPAIPADSWFGSGSFLGGRSWFFLR